jgi:hypothetical protein
MTVFFRRNYTNFGLTRSSGWEVTRQGRPNGWIIQLWRFRFVLQRLGRTRQT